MSSIGLPSGSEFRNTWDKVSKDGKIDKNDYNSLLKSAAESQDVNTLEDAVKTGKIDEQEKAFFEGLKSVSDTKSISVKEGSAKGTIDLFDDSSETNVSSNSKYYPKIELGQTTKTDKVDSTQETVKTDKVEGTAKPSTELDKLKELKVELTTAIEKTQEPAKKEELTKQLEVVNQKISKFESNSSTQPAQETVKTDNVEGTAKPNTELDKLKELKVELTTAIEKTQEPAKKEELTKQLEVVNKKIDELEKLQLPTEKQKAFDEINQTIEKFTKLALETGDMSKFTEGKNEVQKIVEKYPNLKDDPEVKKIKEILSGNFSESSISAGNKVMKAVDTINAGNQFLSNEKPSRKDVDNAKEYVKELPEGSFKKKIEEKIDLYNKGKLQSQKDNEKTNFEGIKDVLGTGFLNSKNEDGIASMFQNSAKRNELDALLKKLSTDEQITAIKALASKGGELNLSIAKKIYDNLSSVANVDEEFNKSTLEKLKSAKKYDSKDVKVDEKSFVDGLKYSMYSEKEASISMIRSILDGDVSPSVLSKFNESEVKILSDIVKKNGTSEEREAFLDVISFSKSNVKTEMLSNEDKSYILSSQIKSGSVSDNNLKETLNVSGKQIVSDLIKKGNLSDKEIALVAKNYDGDKLADNPDVAEKALMASIRTYINDPKGSISKEDLNRLIDQIEKDRDSEKIMKKVINLLGDGSGSEYAKFKELSPATLDKMWAISR